MARAGRTSRRQASGGLLHTAQETGEWQRRAVRRVLVVGVLVLLVVGAVAGARLLSVGKDLREAHDLLDDAARSIEDGRLADASNELALAEQLLLGANSTLHTAPDLQLLDLVPVAHQNIGALRDTVAVALRLAVGGSRLLDTALPLQGADGRLEIPLSDGAIPLDVVEQARVDLGEVRAALDLPGSFRRPSPLVLGPLRDAQREVEDQIEQRRPQITNLLQGLSLLQDMLGGNGDRRYLIAVSNSAEMRGSGGMYLTYGEMRGVGGDLQLEDFGGIDDLALSAPLSNDTLHIPDDELARWEGLNQLQLWRNVNVIPDFPVVAERAMAMYEAVRGLSVDGVIQIDPAGLGAILAGVGPVDVPGLGTVTAENVVDLTLNTAYTAFPDRDQRQEVLGDVAEAAFQRLASGNYPSLRPLGEALFTAASQRHIMVYSPRPAARDALAFFGAAGTMPIAGTQDYALLTVQNFSGNKLDYYIDTALAIAGSRPEGADGQLGVDVTVTNTAPADGLASYVFGPNLPGLAPGDYRTTVSLYVPNGTNLSGASGGSFGEQAVLDTEDGRTVITWALTLPAGASSTVHLDLTMPPRPSGPYALSLVPIPRVRPMTVSVDIDTGADQRVQGSFALEEPTLLTDAGDR